MNREKWNSICKSKKEFFFSGISVIYPEVKTSHRGWSRKERCGQTLKTKMHLGIIHHMFQNSELDQIKTYWRLSEIACLNSRVLCYILFSISDLGITCLDPLWYMLFYISDSEASIWKGEKKSKKSCTISLPWFLIVQHSAAYMPSEESLHPHNPSLLTRHNRSVYPEHKERSRV